MSNDGLRRPHGHVRDRGRPKGVSSRLRRDHHGMPVEEPQGVSKGRVGSIWRFSRIP